MTAKTKSALKHGDKLYAVDGRVLAVVGTHRDAETWCRDHGYTLRLAGTSQSGDRATVLAELAVLDAASWSVVGTVDGKTVVLSQHGDRTTAEKALHERYHGPATTADGTGWDQFDTFLLRGPDGVLVPPSGT